jgi:hypothetical protein
MNAGELSKQKLFVGTPMFGGMCCGMFTRSIGDLSALCTHYGIALQLFFLFNESLITRARNYICDEFMRSTAENLMFIDADIGFDARDVIGLLALQAQNADYDIIGGPYPKKTISWEKIKQAVDKGLADKDPNELDKYVGDFVFNPKPGTSSISLQEPVEVLEIGTGFMMIKKPTMEKFRDAYPEYYYKPDHIRTQHFDGSREILQYFQAEIDQIDYSARYLKLIKHIQNNTEGDLDLVQYQIKEGLAEIEEDAKKDSRRYLSEDYWFSQKAQRLGLKTYLCPWMKLQHMGSFVFGGSLMDLAQAGAQATADAELLNKIKKKVAK